MIVSLTTYLTCAMRLKMCPCCTNIDPRSPTGLLLSLMLCSPTSPSAPESVRCADLRYLAEAPGARAAVSYSLHCTPFGARHLP